MGVMGFGQLLCGAGSKGLLYTHTGSMPVSFVTGGPLSLLENCLDHSVFVP